VLIVQAELEGEEVVVVSQPNTRSNVEVAKLQTFNGAENKMSDFLTAYRLYIRIRIRNAAVEL